MFLLTLTSPLSGQVILTAEVSGGSRGGRVFRSSDFAKNFVQTDLPFHPLTQMMYSPQNSDYLLALSTEVSPAELAFPGLQHQNIPALKDFYLKSPHDEMCVFTLLPSGNDFCRPSVPGTCDAELPVYVILMSEFCAAGIGKERIVCSHHS